jgi:hypothetical protein
MDDNETLDSKRENFSFLGDCLGFGTVMRSTYDAKLYLKQAKNGLWCKGKVKKDKDGNFNISSASAFVI